ncbi:hypothetical protein GRF29_28g2287373 [Pseudopithomyces chartarum]|uniref:Choline transport protein n=1 Tax=Pseudopithomyces chartarum TaxID=1892770 RepID=A0AAN6M1S1_9PLEO|nr:hypothetical protein GRF29_28g2287373 [Pseudopithomyces chartarum]
MAEKHEIAELGEVRSDGADHRDEAALARVGKKTVLKRKFGFLAILGFSCTVLVTWEGFLVLFLVGLQNGGPAGVFYGYLITWLGTTSVFAVLSELVSMAPTSGGQYHWVAMLAPPRYQKVLSYIAGWLTVAGWQATIASCSYLTASLVQGILVLTQPNYTPHNWHATILFWAIIAFAVVITTGANWLLPMFEAIILFIHIAGFLGIIVPLLAMGPHENAHDVFTTFINRGGWDTQGLSFCIGMMGTVYAFVGGDGAIHMAEEIQNAPVTVPRAIMTGVSSHTSIPVNAVAATTVIAIILSFVNIGSATAFNGVISVAIAGIFSSYLLVSSLLLYRRVTGGIISLQDLEDHPNLTNTTGKLLSWGPWCIPGALGIANNAFACAYLSFVFFFTFWPSVKDVQPANMNWSILVTGVITIFSGLYYVISARKTYTGPIIEIGTEETPN